jgi:hypothetical protein
VDRAAAPGAGQPDRPRLRAIGGGVRFFVPATDTAYGGTRGHHPVPHDNRPDNDVVDVVADAAPAQRTTRSSCLHEGARDVRLS